MKIISEKIKYFNEKVKPFYRQHSNLKYNRFIIVNGKKIKYYIKTNKILFDDIDLYYEYLNNKYYLKNICNNLARYNFNIEIIKPDIIKNIEKEIIRDFKSSDKKLFNKIKKQHQYFIKITEMINKTLNNLSDKRDKVLKDVKKLKKKLIYPDNIIKNSEYVYLEDSKYNKIDKIMIVKKNPKTYTVKLYYNDNTVIKKYMKKESILNLIKLKTNVLY